MATTSPESATQSTTDPGMSTKDPGMRILVRFTARPEYRGSVRRDDPPSGEVRRLAAGGT